MAKNVIVTYTDDLSGETSADVVSQSFKLPNFVTDETDSTIDFVVEKWSFDATDESAVTFVRDIQKAVAKYRKNDAVLVKTVGSGDSTNASDYTEAMDKRDFAKSKGLKVSERGRISADVEKAYATAIANGEWVAFQNAPKSDEDNGETTTDEQ
jgi:hypothetical protein